MRKVASVTDIYQVELALVVVVSCFSRPSVLWYEQYRFGKFVSVTSVTLEEGKQAGCEDKIRQSQHMQSKFHLISSP